MSKLFTFRPLLLEWIFNNTYNNNTQALYLCSLNPSVVKYNKPRTWGRFRRGLQIPMTDGLTDKRTDGGSNIYANMYGNVKYLNSNCVFSKTLENTSVAQWRRVGLNFRYHFIDRGEMSMFQYFSTFTQIPVWGQASQPVSEPIAWIYRFISEPKNYAKVELYFLYSGRQEFPFIKWIDMRGTLDRAVRGGPWGTWPCCRGRWASTAAPRYLACQFIL